MASSAPTRGQAERSLSQQIQALYRDQLGHRTGRVTCQLFDEKLVIVVEDSITQPEQLLAQEGREELAERVRADLDSAIQPQLKTIIENILSVAVVDLLSDATLETGRTGMIAVLESIPDVRKSPASSRSKAKSS